MKYLFFTVLLFSLAFVFAQDYYDEPLNKLRPKYEKPMEEEVEIDNSLDTVQITHHQNNMADSLSDVLATFYSADNVPANGHRIQVYTGNSETKAREAEAYIRENYGREYMIYTTFKLQWRVRVGDFLDPLRAHKLYVDLKEQFPNALKVEDIVNVKKVK